MFDYKKQLIDIFENDLSPLLDISSQSTSLNEFENLKENFFEINKYFKEHNQEPLSNQNIKERRLSLILKKIRSDF